MLIGMMYLALAAGLLFARFSRPVAKIVFSKKAMIAPYKNEKGFMVRLSNAKTNLLLEVEAKILLSMTINENGELVRKFYNLPLEMRKINMLALSWTVVHPINDQSPLANFSKSDLDKSNAEFVVMISGYNNTLSQQVHSRTSYKFNEVEWNAKFSPIFTNEDGMAVIAVNKIGDYHKIS
jgi:inward rectifier potassium channel